MSENQPLQEIQIPLESLEKDLLDGIIKDFILREGTDYGDHDYSLEEKIEQVVKLLKSGQASIYFDPNTETCNILEKSQSKRIT